MVPKVARCSVWRRCEGAAHPHPYIFFSFSLTLILCHVKSKPDLLGPLFPSLVLVKDLSCPVLLMSLPWCLPKASLFSGHIPDCFFSPLHLKQGQERGVWGQPLLEKGYRKRREVLSPSMSPLEEPVPWHGAEQVEEEVDVLLLPMSHQPASVSMLKLCPCRRKGDFIHLLGGLQACSDANQLPWPACPVCPARGL